MIFLCVESLGAFFVERLHDFFWWRGCVIFLLGGCMILCVERLWDFSHSLTHSGCMIYFSGACVTF